MPVPNILPTASFQASLSAPEKTPLEMGKRLPHCLNVRQGASALIHLDDVVHVALFKTHFVIQERFNIKRILFVVVSGQWEEGMFR